MITVAVTGANQPVGRALLERLDADRSVERILGVDLVEPDMPVAKLAFRQRDPAGPHLALALEGATVVVNACLSSQVERDEDELFARNVGVTRNVLEAAATVGAVRLVHLSSTAAYGAHADNPLPLTEDAPLRANPDYPPAYHALLAEELVAKFAADHPDVRVVVMRAATTVGHRADSPLTQHLEAPRLVSVQGSETPQQFVHVDDVAGALHLAVAEPLVGAYNVAADGWLSGEELGRVLGKGRLEVPEALAFGAMRRLWASGLWPAPPGMLHFLMYPTVVSAARLHAAGWSPTRSNREVVRELAADRAGWIRLGPLRVRWRSLAAGVAGATAGALAAALAWRQRRRGR